MAIKSNAQKKAVAKYNNANYDQIGLRVPKGKKDIIKAYADAHNISVNSFINNAIDYMMQLDRDNN